MHSPSFRCQPAAPAKPVTGAAFAVARPPESRLEKKSPRDQPAPVTCANPDDKSLAEPILPTAPFHPEPTRSWLQETADFHIRRLWSQTHSFNLAEMTADAGTPSGASSTAPGPSSGLPPGVVLGKDGKPCRTCSSGSAFKSFASTLKPASGSSRASTATTGGALAAAAAAAATATPAPAENDCPPDVEQLGRSTWTLLHSIAATYPTTPSAREQADLQTFMGLFARLYPCWVCAEDFQAYMREREAVRVASRDEFGTWLCRAHNAVNAKLGKPAFDCARWEERWRTGWKDGRCD
ncbi:uncharacterized protein JN550_009578 [Neoarthrinium moseri]|uniref:uncharacterized protein n=1 Tax=Neoarthrinium moseri TaxID=1658444 RepID=UPI001FDC5D62|nr:uncharacterized protein JN550_009578 [Neoarthrinium moseri]KAI1863467.1 hypothetical protein JN550_009578 [Neoarthrinium moseri]